MIFASIYKTIIIVKINKYTNHLEQEKNHVFNQKKYDYK